LLLGSLNINNNALEKAKQDNSVTRLRAFIKKKSSGNSNVVALKELGPADLFVEPPAETKETADPPDSRETSVDLQPHLRRTRLSPSPLSRSILHYTHSVVSYAVS